MKKARISNLGALAMVFGGAAVAGGIAYSEWTPRTIADDFIDAARAAAAERSANAAASAQILANCDEVENTIAALVNGAAIGRTMTVSRHNPIDAFPNGYCVLAIDGKTIAIINDPDELSAEGERNYILRQLMENLTSEDLIKIENHLNAPAP